MITREEYDEAERIVLAYHRQILTVIGSVQNEHSKPSKSLENVKEGDYAECIFVHSSSKKHLTKGKKYPVIRVSEYRFLIESDSGKKKSYYLTNTHFKVV